MLIIENLTIKNNQHTLLSNANFSVKRGECLAIIGASGSGKSILANALLESLPRGFVQTGSISFNNPAHSTLAIVAQAATALNPSSRVRSQLIQQLEKRWKRWRQPATQINLTESLQQASLTKSILPLYPYQLSGGMAKRVLTALALIQDTDFIVADEPTCGLELQRAQAVFKELAELRNNKKAGSKKGVIIISHDLPGLMQVADRILVLKDGCIIDETTPQAILSGLANNYTQALWQASPANWMRRNNAQAM
ncbi:MAG: ATP-binding cassette domain-containing protein [Moritella sp.]|uniref:ATP-binding cassette domain-containing protein n=1 Tax=Moritella sp. TaxID=78556 RepID=UPI0029B63977|nr:ATP-binding cassette domain-containing protein [Moritella sp.]MDX2320099.1 ATP-binding cassette domain-containing protein [Moritella sp.]